LAPSEARSGSA